MNDRTETGAAPAEFARACAAFLACDARIRAIGRARGLRPDELDDLVHDVFLAFARRWPGVRANAPGWLATAAFHRANRLHRQRRRREARDRRREVRVEAPRVSELEWADALARLSAPERRVLLLYLDGVRRDDLPRAAGVTHQAARALLESATRQIRAWFG